MGSEDYREMMQRRQIEQQMKLLNALFEIEEFLGRMIKVRDHFAEFGSYPTDGGRILRWGWDRCPREDQSFDDWAVDQAEEILEEIARCLEPC